MKVTYRIKRCICALTIIIMLAALSSCAPRENIARPQIAASGINKVYAGSSLDKEYVAETYTATCTKYTNRLDIMRIWAVDTIADGYCETKTRTERMCDH